MHHFDRPIIISGPCVAESKDLLFEVCDQMQGLSRKLNFEFVFKASFDKANRTSISSYRGPGWSTAANWFTDVKDRFGVSILTDVHEVVQVNKVAEVCDFLQIPAFLCRQTDLLIACVESGRSVNIKKGQFMAPESMQEIVNKAREVCASKNLPLKVMLTERGASFGYGNLVVDLRSFPIMAQTQVPVIFDITHSTQLPPSNQGDVKTSGGQRRFAPVLARAAAVSGYVSGFFLEVHTDPASAKSDRATQLSLKQATDLLNQIIPLWRTSSKFHSIDNNFIG